MENKDTVKKERIHERMISEMSDRGKNIQFIPAKESQSDMQFAEMVEFYTKLKCAAYGISR